MADAIERERGKAVLECMPYPFTGENRSETVRIVKYKCPGKNNLSINVDVKLDVDSPVSRLK